MKKLIFKLPVLALIVLLFSCTKEEKDKQSIGVTNFSIQIENNLKFSENYNSDQEPSSIIISLKDAENNMVFSFENISLIKHNDNYLSEQIDLVVGDYTIEYFIVVNSENEALYISPKANTEFADLVDKPLPVSFNVSKDNATTVLVEILPANIGDPLDFGYANFGFIVANTLEKGLVALYPFNGNANDLSKFQNNGIVNGANLDLDRNNNPNSSYKFDGIDDFIEIPFSEAFNFGIYNFSISLWIKTVNTYGPNMILQKGSKVEGLSTPQYWIRANDVINSSELVFLTADGNPPSDKTYANNLNLTDGNWHHIIAQRKNDSLELYVDLKLVSKHYTDYRSVNDTIGMIIGAQYPNSDVESIHYHFEGNIDDIRIYNRALTELEIFEISRLN